MVSFIKNLFSIKLQLKSWQVIIIITLLISTSLHAQIGLEVPVKVDVENGNMDDVFIKLMKNGKTIFSQSSTSRLKLRLNFNSNYTILFSKPGYITKSVEFDTKAPADHIADGFDPYKIGVKLFKQYDGVNITVYNQPVGKIHFDKDLDEFNYDTDYSKSILSNLKETEEKLAARAEEEKRTGETAISVEGKQVDEAAPVPAPVPPVNTTSAINEPIPLTQHDPITSNTGNGDKDVASKIKGSGGEQTKDYFAMDGSNDISASTTVNQGNDVGNASNSNQGIDPGKGKLANQNGVDMGTMRLINEDEKITREDIVEKTRVITLIHVTRGKTTTHYRRVAYHWGGPFYFINEISNISENVFANATGIVD